MNLWIKNTSGSPSASLTMMIVAFTAIMLWFVLSIVQKVGPFAIRPFSGTESMAVFAPLAALYFGRRQQELGTLATQPADPVQPTTTPGATT